MLHWSWYHLLYLRGGHHWVILTAPAWLMGVSSNDVKATVLDIVGWLQQIPTRASGFGLETWAPIENQTWSRKVIFQDL